MTFVNLAGKKFKDNGEDADSKSSESEIQVVDENVAYKKPIHWCTFYVFCRNFMKLIMHQFFESITVLGLHNIPKKGPVIFCGNHNNQFVDGSIAFFTSNRDV